MFAYDRNKNPAKTETEKKTLINCLNFVASIRCIPNRTKSKSMFHIFRFATLPLNGIKVNGKPSRIFKYLWWCDCYNRLIYPSSIHKMQTISHFVSAFSRFFTKHKQCDSRTIAAECVQLHTETAFTVEKFYLKFCEAS